MVEDFTPYDPRPPVLVRWGDRVFRIVDGSLERPIAHVNRLWIMAQCIDRALVPQLGFGLFDVVELVLSRVDAITTEVAPCWDQSALAGPGQSPTMPESAAIAAARAPGFPELAARCQHPERAVKALEYFTSTAAAVRGDPFDPLGTYGPIIAISGSFHGNVALPTAHLMESLLSIPEQLARMAVSLDPGLEAHYGSLVRRRLTRLLIGAGYRVAGQIKIGNELIYAAVFISDTQVAILDVAAGLTNETVASKVVSGGQALASIRPGSELETPAGPIEIPVEAQVVRAIVRTGYGTTSNPAPVLGDSDLEWIIRDRVESRQDLWYFLRDLENAPGVAEILAADVIDKFEVWKTSRSFHNGGSSVDLMVMQPHAAIAEWELAAASAGSELALQRLGFPSLRDWPSVILHDEMGCEVADLHEGLAWEILPWKVPVAVQKSSPHTPAALAETLFHIGQAVVWKLRQCRAELEAAAKASGVDSFRVAILHDPTPWVGPAVAGDTTTGDLILAVRDGITEALMRDSRAVESQVGRAISVVFDATVRQQFVDAWLKSSPGIRMDAMDSPQSAQNLGAPTGPDAALVSEAEAELGRYLAQMGQPPGFYAAAAAVEFESQVAFPWLLSHFHTEVCQLSPSALLSRALIELERVNRDQLVRAQQVAWERGFPMNDDVNWAERIEEGSQLRRVIEFIIEEILARPPSGVGAVGEYQWKRCLASAQVCVESCTRSEAMAVSYRRSNREGLRMAQDGRRRQLMFEDRVQIAVGIKQGLADREIAELVGRDRSVVWRERHRNSWKTRGYAPVAADSKARKRRARPQLRKIDTDPMLAARVRADLFRSRTPRQVAGRLHLEAADATVGTVKDSPDAQGGTVSHEAIYRWIYAHPAGVLASEGIILRSRRVRRKRRRPLGERTGGRIVGMVSIDDRPVEASDRRVPGAWEGDLIIGAAGKTAAATLVERHSRFVVILGLPQGKNADGLAEVLIDHVQGLPDLLRGSLTWDQGTEMARHAQLTLATELPVYFAHPHSPWERPTNENTNGLIREYLPKGVEIPHHQPFLDSIANELNDRPRQTLGYLTPREALERLLQDPHLA